MQVNRGLGMLTIALGITLASFALNASAAVSAAKGPGMSYVDTNKILTVSQLQRGMKGYGLTVFQGTKIEKFNVEILGTLAKANNGRDYILAKFTGGPLSGRGMGVAHGMSGSPVYINGRLVGAVSAAMEWSREPIGMITPITDMVEALDDNLPKHPSGYSSTMYLDQPTVVGGRSYSKVIVDSPDAASSDPADGAMHITPLAMPVMVSGFNSTGIDELQQILKPYNIKVMAGVGGGSQAVKEANPALVPGAAVGMALATGDIDMTATGTVTYRNGNKLVAFGHPFMTLGAIDAPMTTAYIVDVLSSYDSSTKLAFPLKTVGHISQDRPWSIAGTVGAMPKMIPVNITVDDLATKRNKVFHVKVVNHPLLAWQLSGLVVGQAIAQMHSTPGDTTTEVSYELNADQIGTVRQRNVYYSSGAIDKAAISDLNQLLQLVGNNKFMPLDIKSLNVNVRIEDKHNTATIDRIYVKKSEYAPGETVDVGVVLRPYKKDRITKTYQVKIPATAPNGKVTLQVRGGSAPAQNPLMMMLGGSPDAGSDPMANADNVKQMVNKLLEHERNNQVAVQLLMPSSAINVAGENLTGLPNSIAEVMKSSRNSGLRMERDEVKKVYDENLIVTGLAKLQIDVKQDSVDENKPASSTPSAPVTSASSDDVDFSAPYAYAQSGSGPGNASFASLVDVASKPTVAVTEKPAAAKDTKPAATTPATPAKAEETKPAAPEQPAAPSDIKTVVRQPQTWSQRTQSEFSKGTFSGVAASSDNELVLTPKLEKLADTPEQFVWTVTAAGGNVYAGTGNSGKIYQIDAKGDAKLFCDTDELEVQSLVIDSKGDLYAGTSPNGRIFKITPDGKAKMLYKTGERYVLALAIDNNDNIYAGVGDAGKIYRVTPDGTGKVFSNINEQQILSLNWTPQNGLIAGTGINGVVYKVSDTGLAKPVFDAAEGSVTSVASDGQGNIYAGTSPKGVVYKVAPDGNYKSVYAATVSVLALAADESDNIYAISDGHLARIAPDGTVTEIDSGKEKAQYLALSYDRRAGTLYAGTGNIGSVYACKRGDSTGTYESPVHDAKLISRWGRIKWTADAPQGTVVQLETRTGNVETPDSTWSPWSKAYADNAGEQIAGPNARFIQYRVTLKSPKPGTSPKVSGVTVSYMTPNQPPAVKITEPSGGAVLAGSKTIRWTGSDPDKDKLTYDVFYSRDQKQWTALVGGTETKTEEKKLTAEEITAKVNSELEKSPDIPKEMKDTFIKDQAGAAAAASKSAGSPSTSTSYNWDTKKVEDGAYYIKVVASDRGSNATGPLTDKDTLGPITICNTPPALDLQSPASVTLDGTGPVTVTGSTSSKMVDITGVQYRVDGGEWTAAASDDGVFDSSRESFKIITDALTSGTHKLEIQSVDAAGNAASQTIDIKVS